MATPSRLQRPGNPSDAPLREDDPVDRYRCRLSLRRVAIMSVLTYGLYLFYWAFFTWLRRRQHTSTQAYPVWHALSLALPVYAWRQMAAHVRAFQRLALEAGTPWYVTPGRAAGVMAVITILAWVPLALRPGGLTFGDALVVGVTGIALSGVVAWLLTGLQRDINAYWRQVLGDRLLDAQVRIGEIALGMVGAALWVDTILTITSARYRAGL